MARFLSPGQVWAGVAKQRLLVTRRDGGTSCPQKPGRRCGQHSGRIGPEGTCHLILEKALDGGAEGTAHEALGSGRVMQEADLQGEEPILQWQSLHDLMALPVPDIQVAPISSWVETGR